MRQQKHMQHWCKTEYQLIVALLTAMYFGSYINIILVIVEHSEEQILVQILLVICNQILTGVNNTWCRYVVYLW